MQMKHARIESRKSSEKSDNITWSLEVEVSQKIDRFQSLDESEDVRLSPNTTDVIL